MNEMVPKTILAIDDTPSNLDMLLSLLDEYDVIPSTSGKDALSLLQEEKIDLILLDILMPEMDGYALCCMLKENPATRDIPIIFITAKTDEESIEKAYELGGADYVTKPFKPKELKARVKVQLNLQDYIRQLDYLATRDTLTGIYNRRKFFENGEAIVAASQHQLFVLMLDIDHFKHINDTYGHHTGDVTLQMVTAAITETLPQDALFGRLGGEEFGVLLKAATREEALQKADSIRTTVASLRIPDGHNNSFSCTLSIGIAENTSEHPEDLESLLKSADKALYDAKEGGRNRSILRNR